MAANGAAKFWDEELTVAVIGKNDRGDEIRVRRVRKGSTWFCDIRNYYRDQESGRMRPAKGIAVPDDLADEVAEAVISGAKQH